MPRVGSTLALLTVRGQKSTPDFIGCGDMHLSSFIEDVNICPWYTGSMDTEDPRLHLRGGGGGGGCDFGIPRLNSKLIQGDPYLSSVGNTTSAT
jgi:hypothetical protein